MCGICGVQAQHHEDLVPLLLDLTDSNWPRGHDAVGNSVINPVTGKIDSYVNVRKAGSSESPLIDGFRIEIGKKARDIDARFGLGQTKFTTVNLSADEKVVRTNTQPLQLIYRRDSAMIPEATGIQNGEVAISPIRDEITTPSLSEATVDTRYALELYYQRFREQGNHWDAAQWMMERLAGGYVFGFSEGSDMFFFTDPSGIRPAVVGKKKGEHGDIFVLSSEDGFFGELGITPIHYMKGGEGVLFSPEAEPEIRELMTTEQRPCWFEPHYFQRHHSTNSRQSNFDFRREEGGAIAALYKSLIEEYDISFPAPNSGTAFEAGITDVADVLHTVACRKPEIRGNGLRNYLVARTEKPHKFIYTPHEIAGKNGVAVDDSCVGGDTAAEMFLDWKRYGGGRMLLISCAPPMFFPCPYGVGFPKKDNLITAGAVEAGVAEIGEDGEVSYDIDEVNRFVTGKIRAKIATLATEYDEIVDPNDFRIVYATKDIIRGKGAYISDTGSMCDYCFSGNRADYRKDIPFDLLP